MSETLALYRTGEKSSPVQNHQDIPVNVTAATLTLTLGKAEAKSLYLALDDKYNDLYDGREGRRAQLAEFPPPFHITQKHVDDLTAEMRTVWDLRARLAVFAGFDATGSFDEEEATYIEDTSAFDAWASERETE